MKKGREVINREHFRLTLDRLCYELIESHDLFENTCLIGIQPRGVFLSDRIVLRLTEILGEPRFRYGRLDITFYRDDFRTRVKPLKANKTELDFLVEDKRVVLIDDVLYTGRTVQAALTALNHYGRPLQVELLSLVDRRFNRHLPIQSDYIGVTVDALDDAYVKVQWSEEVEGEDRIVLFANKKDSE